MKRTSLLGGLLVVLLGVVVAWQLLRDHDEAAEHDSEARVVQRATGSDASAPPRATALPTAAAPVPAPLPAATPAPELTTAPGNTATADALGGPGNLGDLGDLGEAVHITARIVDARGAPLAGARVAWLPTAATLQAAGLLPGAATSGAHAAPKSEDLPHAALASLPQQLTGPDGRVAFDTRHIAYVPTEDDVFGIPVEAEPALIVTLAGWTTRTFPVTDLTAGARDLGDIGLEVEAIVSGRAVDEDGSPLPGVRVRLTNQQARPKELPEPFWQSHCVPELMQVVTAEDGRFTLTGLWQGRATLDLLVTGRIRRDFQCAPLAGTTLEVGDVILQRGAAITGRVLDADGAPLAGAQVSVVDGELHFGVVFDVGYGYEDGDDSIHDELAQAVDNARHASVLTDATGAFRVGGLDSPQVSVYATADGFEPGRLRPVVPGSSDLQLVLQREAVLHVTVIDRVTRVPLPDAAVRVVRLSGVDADRADVELRVEPEGPGAFLAHVAGPRSHRVTASAAGYADAVLEAPGVQAPLAGHVVVELGPQAVLAGRVRDARGAPLAGATVALQPPGKPRLAFTQVSTDAQGAFRIERLAALNAELVAFAAGTPDSAPLAIALAEGEQREGLEVRVPAPARIHGTVRKADGTPESRDNVRLDIPPYSDDFMRLYDLGDRFVPWVNVDAQGRYAFEALAAGEYRLRSFAAGEVTCTLAEGEDREIDFRAAAGVRLHGRVMSGGRGAAGVQVKADKAPDADGSYIGWAEPAITDADGAYVLQLIAGGELEVYADPRGGHESEHHAIHANPGDDLVVDITLPGGHIAGRVVDDVSGAPISKLEVILYRDGNLMTAYTSTAEDGSFSLNWLAPDSYRLRIDGRGLGERAWSEMLVVKLEPRDLVLAEGQVLDDVLFKACRGAKLEGDVRLADGNSVKDGVEVQLVRMDHGRVVPGTSGTYSSSDDEDDSRLVEGEDPIWARGYTEGGRYRFIALPAGEYRVLAGEATPEEVRDRGLPAIVGEHETARLGLVAR